MKKKFFILIYITVISVISGFASSNFNIAYAERNTTESEIVMEISTGRILYGKNINDKMFMASTTKILTAITVIENTNLTDIVTVTKETIGVEGSSIYLEEGEKLTVKDLLYGLMLRSGNDCAETLAVYTSGNIDKFVSLMNDTAKKIGAKNSNFVNPHGLHDDNHYTTAYDLGLISCYAMKNNTFKEIVNTKTFNIPFTTRDCNRHLINKNKMLKEFDGANGIKTGYTKAAGRCLVSSCLRNEMGLVCVVLNCQDMFNRSKELLETTFNDYSLTKIIDCNNIICFVDGENGKKIPLYTDKDVILPLSKEEKDKIKIIYDYPSEIKCNLKKDSEIGSFKIYIENNLIFQQKIYTIIST